MTQLLAELDPLTHVVQHPIWQPTGYMTLLSNQIIMQIIAAALLIFFLPRFVKQRAGTDDVGRLVPRGWGNAIEGLCEALRVHVAQPTLGPYTERFIPYIWSVFYFILVSNLLGLIPISNWTSFPVLGNGHVWGGTSTGNIAVTATLAICTLGMIVVNGLRLHGMNYVKHFFMGPPLLNAFIALLEVIGLVAKTFALAMRLFANMVAGHILLAVLIGFISMAYAGLSFFWAGMLSIPIVIGAVAINFLELFVAFLQAFIFTFLTAMFLGQAVNIHHEHHEEHGAVEHAKH